jgi:mRNA-degrading endonuclease toxin of MazEF toxin-antitoxin module
MGRWEPWLLAAGAVVLLAAVIWTVRKQSTPAGIATRPRRGDIWWAEVPFSDGTGAKVRPCLVMLRHRRGIVVLKITSQDKSERRDHLPIPTRGWDPAARHDSFLNLAEPVMLRPGALRRHAGTCDATVLRAIRGRAGLQSRDLHQFARHAG